MEWNNIKLNYINESCSAWQQRRLAGAKVPKQQESNCMKKLELC
jgi:hypothetical protein